MIWDCVRKIKKIRKVYTVLTVILFTLAMLPASADLAPNPEIFGIDVFAINLLLVFFLINLCIELSVAVVYSVIRKLKKRKIVLAVSIANAVSYPPFILILLMLMHSGARELIIPLEIIVILVECCIINKITKIGWKESFCLSLATNLASFLYSIFIVQP
jgi:asparagine N-glycosylation enzyme membrane subunit Stt3